MRNFSLTILCCFSVFLSSCEKEDDTVTTPPTGTPGTPTITAQIDGTNFSASGTFIQSVFVHVNDSVQTLAMGGAEFSANGSIFTAITLELISTDFNGIQTGDVFTGTSSSKLGLGEYSLDDGIIYTHALSEYTKNANMTITSIDYAQKIVSGTFYYTGIDSTEPNITYSITNGVFTDIPFN